MPEEKETIIKTPEPDPALRCFDKLVGAWELKGRTLGSKEDNITGWNTFEWMPGGFFLKSSGEIDFKGFIIKSVEIISYDPSSRTFPSNVYSNMSGSVLQYEWNIRGNEITHWMEAAKYTGILSDDGKTLTGGWKPFKGREFSGNVAYDAVMTRVK